MGNHDHNRHRPKRGGSAVPLLWWGRAGFPSNTTWPGPRSTSVPSGIYIHPSICHNRHGPETGGCALFRGTAGSPSNNVAWAEAFLHTKWHLDPSSHLATTDMGRKLGGGELGPHLTQCGRGPRPTCMPSFILIHPTVWPQYINVTDRTGQTRVQ